MLRCRRCRKEIIDSASLLAGEDTGESPATLCSIWHVNVDALPEWILTLVHQAQWTVGKLNCRNCSARLGGFDFIHHFECPCGRDAAIHLNKSRVDPEHKQCFLTLQPRMRKEQSHLLRVEPQNEESSRPASHACSATSISGPAGASRSLSASESSRLFSFSPLYCVRKRRQRSLEDAAPLRSSCWCSAGPADTPPAWVMAAGTDERAHASPAPPPQPDAAGQASVSSCPLPPARRRSPAHHLLEEDLSSAETSAVQGDIQRAGPVPAMVTGGEEQVSTEAVMVSLASSKLSKRAKNRLKGLRRKQRKKERWLRSQLEEAEELLQDSEEDREDRDGLTCAVCLDIYICPHICRPCGHSFCEPCLRTMANNRPMSTACPLCRTLISHTSFNKELDQTAQTFFPKVYCTRKQDFQSAACAKWPLPNTRKSLCTFWSEQRRATRTRAHWRFHHHGVYSLAAWDRTSVHAGLFDICLVILYIRSANWILVFLFLFVLVYYFCF